MAALPPREFANELTTMVARHRAMWDHPFARKIRSAELRKEQPRGWIEQQFYLTGKVHDIMGPLYVKCEDAKVRAKMLENLLEEETGRISRGAPHPELFIGLGIALGSTSGQALGAMAIQRAAMQGGSTGMVRSLEVNMATITVLFVVGMVMTQMLQRLLLRAPLQPLES